jgi:hypothetical protein
MATCRARPDKPLRRAAAGMHDGGLADDSSTDWAGYYAWSGGRQPRPMLLAACQELRAGQERVAVDPG